MNSSNGMTLVNVTSDANKKLEKNFSYSVDNNMYWTVRVIHSFAKLFGLMAFTIKYDQEKYPKQVLMSVFDVLSFLACISFRFYSLYGFWNFFQFKFSSTILIFLRGVTVICMTLFIILIIGSILDIKNRRKYLRIFQKIISIEAKLNLFGVEFRNLRNLCVVCGTSFMLITIAIFQSLLSAYVYCKFNALRDFEISFFRLALEVAFNYGITALMKNYLFCLVYVNLRLKLIKKYVRNSLGQVEPEKVEFYLKLLRKAYDELADVVDNVNSCFAFQVRQHIVISK